MDGTKFNIIEQAWENEVFLLDETLKAKTLEAVLFILNQVDAGLLRAADKIAAKWRTNETVKKAILLYFKLFPNQLIDQQSSARAYDKVPLKFCEFSANDFQANSVRVVPGAIVRKFAYLGANTVIMPSFVNVGAYVGEKTLVDTWASIGSCAQVGKSCHISGGVGIGGVLEPINANPVIIEDNVFIGARSEIVEGVIVGEGSVLSMGVFIGASTRIYDRATKEIHYGYVPPYSVVVPGTLPSSDGITHTYAAIIVKTVDSNTRAKTEINNLLRNF